MAPPQDPYADALAHARAGRFGAALAAVERALAAQPRSGPALGLKAALQLERGDAAAALVTCEQALALDPKNGRAQVNRGDALARLGRPAEALAAYDAALAGDPANLAAQVNRGGALIDLQRPAEALAAYDAVLQRNPGLAAAHVNRARALAQLGRAEDALAAANQALQLQPANARAWVNRGEALHGLRRHEEALASYRQAATHDPRSAEAAIGAGMQLRALGRYDEAVAAFDAAERLDPTNAVPAYQRGLVRLLTGDFARGWPDYEARWDTPGFLANSTGFALPQLRERLVTRPTPEAFAGQRVLVVGEQGIGDQLMFASLLPDLLATAASASVICDRRLVGLLGGAFPQARFFDLRDTPADLSQVDVVVAGGSLAHAFRRRAEDFPGTAFLTVDPARRAAWAERLGPARGRRRIGVSWRGGTAGTNREGRSMDLVELAPLFALPEAEFVSLQYGDVAAEAAGQPALRVFPAAEIDDFAELAALIANLDLVVSVQTAVVHLAGALGTPCLTLVPLRAEWRYTAGAASMPWYRSVRLFRQAGTADWAPVIARVVQAAS
jgi:tetratricopeptide (TPR) repeat protein